MPRALFASAPTRLRRLEHHFTPTSRSRGITYAAQGRVEVCDANDTWLAATVRGSREYDVDLELADGRVIASCTCPYADGGEPCKHVWATLVVGEAEGALPWLGEARSLVLGEMGDDDQMHAVEAELAPSPAPPPVALVAPARREPTPRPAAASWRALMAAPSQRVPTASIGPELRYVVEVSTSSLCRRPASRVARTTSAPSTRRRRRDDQAALPRARRSAAPPSTRPHDRHAPRARRARRGPGHGARRAAHARAHRRDRAPRQHRRQQSRRRRHTRTQTAASASAPWGADHLVATPTTKASAISAALDGDGNVVLTYADASEVLSFVKLASGATAFTAPAVVATSSTLASHVAAAANADGHLEIVYLDPSNLLFHTWQQGVGGPWAAPTPFVQAGNAALQIAIATNADGRLDVFYVGTDNQLYHDPQTVPSGGWDGQHLLGASGELVSSVTVGSSGNQLTVLYARQSNGAVYSMQQPSSTSLYTWTPEVALGTGYGPAVATQMLPVAAADGCLGVVYAGSSGVLYQQEQQCMTDGKWSDSQTPFASSDDVALSLAVGAAADGTEQVFFVSGGSSHFLFHAAMTSGGWGAPEPM